MFYCLILCSSNRKSALVGRSFLEIFVIKKEKNYIVYFYLNFNTSFGSVGFTRVGTLKVATIYEYLQLIQNRYVFRSFTILQCSHQHCVQPVTSDVEVVGYL